MSDDFKFREKPYMPRFSVFGSPLPISYAYSKNAISSTILITLWEEYRNVNDF